jgi:predicted RNase H-like HicB family nuclease
MKTAYPAIIHTDSDGIWVEFPDLDGCFSDGETVADAVTNAQDALGAYLCSLLDRNITPAAPSEIHTIDPGDGVVSVVVADPLRYKKDTRAVKKTLTIPAWLNEEAIKRNLNFSAILQEALRAQIQA